MADVTANFEVDPRFKYLHGYSAGAHFAYGFGLFNSSYLAGIGVYAGSLDSATADGIWPDQAGSPIPVFIAHGSEDGTVPYAEAQDARDALEAAGWPVELWTAEGQGHGYASAHHGPAWSFWTAER